MRLVHDPGGSRQEAIPPLFEEALQALQTLGVIREAQTECATLTGGSESALVVVGRPGRRELVIKSSPVEGRVAAEAAYLRVYGRSRLLARVRHVDPKGRYYAYDYLSGERLPQRCPDVDKAATLAALARDLFNRYRPFGAIARKLGGMNNSAALAWQPGWLASVPKQRQRFGEYLPREGEALALELAAASLRRVPAQAGWLLHGDPGPHNFLFGGGRLTGVIDPTVRVGEPIYDLARAFAAWPGDFSLETLLPAVEALETWRTPSRRALIEAVLPPLYGQVIACLWHQPEDLPGYQDGWDYWTRLLAAA